MFRRLGLQDGKGSPEPPGRRVRAKYPTRLETRTKESNVHASLTALTLDGEANAKSANGPSRAMQRSPNWAPGLGLEFEHVMLGPEKRRAMLE